MPDEFRLIARWFAPLAAAAPGAFGLTDDGATLAVPAGRSLVVTTDMLVAGVHFLADDPADGVGVKALSVNLSDLAAMGAEPTAYLLSIALPSAWREEALTEWLESFTAGLAEVQRTFRTTLIGGDTVSTQGPLCVAVTAFGAVESGRELRRSGARPGDTVFVSGTIGDGIIGLRELTGKRFGPLEPGSAEEVIERFRRPKPRLALGRRLVGVASACADVSDGLVADLAHICETSGVAATVEAVRIPLSAAGRSILIRDPSLLPALVTGGDDYELVFTAPGERADAIFAAATEAGVSVSAIGRIVTRDSTDAPVTVVGRNGEALDVGPGGWRHFR